MNEVCELIARILVLDDESVPWMVGNGKSLSLPLLLMGFVRLGAEQNETRSSERDTCRQSGVGKSFQLFTLSPNYLVGQAGHPKTFADGTFHRLVGVFRTCINETEKALDD